MQPPHPAGIEAHIHPGHGSRDWQLARRNLPHPAAGLGSAVGVGIGEVEIGRVPWLVGGGFSKSGFCAWHASFWAPRIWRFGSAADALAIPAGTGPCACAAPASRVAVAMLIAQRRENGSINGGALLPGGELSPDRPKSAYFRQRYRILNKASCRMSFRSGRCLPWDDRHHGFVAAGRWQSPGWIIKPVEGLARRLPGAGRQCRAQRGTLGGCRGSAGDAGIAQYG